jgi:hypothetical protein
MVTSQEFTLDDIKDFPQLGVLKSLAEGVVRQTVAGFSPNRIDKFPVIICMSMDGNWLVTLELENNENRLVKFDYFYFKKDSSVFMGIVTETVERKMSKREIFEALPLY